MDLKDIRGDYDLSAGGTTYKMSISGEPGKPKVEVKQDTNKLKSKLDFKDNWFNLSFSTEAGEKIYRMTGLAKMDSDNIGGKLVLPNGSESTFTAKKTASFSEKEKKKDEKKVPELIQVSYPITGYGYKTRPQSENILFKNATVWTSEEAGILENTDVLIRDGKISKIGQDLRAGNAKIIDATGKHLTAGIIDEHSHIAALAINEGGHNSSAEVKMEDVVDPEDMGIYHDLGAGSPRFSYCTVRPTLLGGVQPF